MLSSGVVIDSYFFCIVDGWGGVGVRYCFERYGLSG